MVYFRVCTEVTSGWGEIQGEEETWRSTSQNDSRNPFIKDEENRWAAKFIVRPSWCLLYVFYKGLSVWRAGFLCEGHVGGIVRDLLHTAYHRVYLYPLVQLHIIEGEEYAQGRWSGRSRGIDVIRRPTCVYDRSFRQPGNVHILSHTCYCRFTCMKKGMVSLLLDSICHD